MSALYAKPPNHSYFDLQSFKTFRLGNTYFFSNVSCPLFGQSCVALTIPSHLCSPGGEGDFEQKLSKCVKFQPCHLWSSYHVRHLHSRPLKNDIYLDTFKTNALPQREVNLQTVWFLKTRWVFAESALPGFPNTHFTLEAFNLNM